MIDRQPIKPCARPGSAIHLPKGLNKMEIYPSNRSVKSISVIRSSESHCQYRQDQAMTPEQFTQVFEAILEGKYSWACVLTLKFTGYNPLHYIPYRTYKRLLKENNHKSHPLPETRDRNSGLPTCSPALALKSSAKSSPFRG